jgi:FAD binding domain
VGIGAFLNEETARNMLADLKTKKNVVLPKSFMTMTFGPGAFFGTTWDSARFEKPPSKDENPASKDLNRNLPFAGWWSTFPMEPAPTSKTSFAEVKDKVLAKHKGWTPLIVALIENSGLDGTEKTFVLPRWITPPLPKWTSDSGRIVLAGDAAHCMPPDSGQGVSCAVEDAMTIALLSEALFTGKDAKTTTDEDKLKKLCDLYTKLRKPRCEYIVAEARKRGDMKREMSVVEQTIRNVVMWAMCKVMPESTMDAFYSYDVAAEVKKALRGETPSAKGKGRVITSNEK